ncbi:MAG: hypothetical protein L0H29_11205, partial [Sinobacteraceae bacterium]|nr:hypothetical protein [Nevskiaceae bacterium]
MRQHADGARRTWQEALKEVNETARGDNGLDFQRVFHGGPHRDIEQHGFKLQKIGSGEGHQAYGWGIYFAKLRDVAESYRDSIKKNPMKIVERDGKYHLMILDSQLHPAEKITFDSREAAEAYFRANYPNQDGQLYHAEIPEDSDLLDWDKPLSEQPAGVRAKLEAIDKELPEHAHEELVENLNADWDELTGREMYKYLERLAAEGELPHQDELTADVGHPARAASEWLNGHGIPGLRYLDALSRQKWAIVEDGGAFYAENFGGQKREFATREDAATFATEQNAKESHNYVIWDEAHLNNDVTPYFSRSETPDDAEVGRIMRQYADHPKLPSKSDIAEAVRQYRQVESDNAESLRAHREGEPLPAPNGKPSNLNARNWVLTRTPNFRKWAGDWLSLQHRKFLDGDPVAAMRGDEVPANLGTMKAMIDWVSKDWETRYGGKAHNPSLGDVAVDRAAARDSAGHGMSKIKQKAFYLAPEIIEKGHVIGRLPKVANKPDAFVVAAPVRIGNAEYYGLVEVRRDA